MNDFEKCHKKVTVKFKRGQYKAILDLAKAFKMKPAQMTVSLAMIGAFGWLVCGEPRSKAVKFPAKKRRKKK